MNIAECANIAREWVDIYETPLEGFAGAYIGGSTAGMGDCEPVPAGSDMDVFVVLTAPPPEKRGKFMYKNALIEISYIDFSTIYPAEKALSDYHLSNSLRYRRVIADTNGRLTAFAAEVAEKFPLEKYIKIRRDHAISRVNGLANMREDASLPDFTLSWLFPTGIICHAILVSALENPTVRKRYLAAKKVLEKFGMNKAYEKLLDVSGMGDVSSEMARYHLSRLEPLFDDAARMGKTPFFFSSDVSPQSRATAIDESYKMIENGFHREMLFWTCATFCRAMKILEADAPETAAKYQEDFQNLLTDLHHPTREAATQMARNTLAEIPYFIDITNAIIEKTRRD